MTVTSEKKSAAAVKKHKDEWVKLGGAIQAIPHDMRTAARAATTGSGGETLFQQLGAGKFLTRAGVRLSPDEFRRFRAAFSQLGAGGTVPGKGTSAFGYVVKPGDTVIDTHVKLDGREVAMSTTRHQQKRHRRTPHSGADRTRADDGVARIPHSA